MKKSKKTRLALAIKTALGAGKLIMASYGKLKTSQISTKAKNDFVTELDKKSEKLIIAAIRKYFPDDGIQAEESGAKAGNDTVWAIDPLDGTVNYIHQFPLFSISIGIIENGVVTAGVVYDPLHKELFTVENGKGSFLNHRRIHTAKTPDIANALLTTGIPFRSRYRFDEYMASFRAISLASAGMRRGGSAALDLAYVACGRLDGFWELDLAVWDIAAGALLVTEAGGLVTDMWGNENYLKSGDIVAAASGVHKGLSGITRTTIAPVVRI